MMKENWVYCRGDIYCAKLDPVVGSEQGGIRPVIVIQNDTGNKHAPTLIVATVTTRIHKKANMPTHFVIYDNPAFKEASVVQLEQIRTIDKSRIDNYLGKVTPREMVAIEKALSVSLAMEVIQRQQEEKTNLESELALYRAEKDKRDRRKKRSKQILRFVWSILWKIVIIAAITYIAIFSRKNSIVAFLCIFVQL